MKQPKTVILVPTPLEAEAIREILPSDVILETTGVGPYRCAAVTAEVITRYAPQRLILSGIAGAYPQSGLSIGQSVWVAQEREADLGSFSGGDFTPKFMQTYVCPFLPHGGRVAYVNSNSVCAAAAPFVNRQGVQIENMEGAAFFYTCLQWGVSFLELRAISNQVGDPFPVWDIRGATEALARTLGELIQNES